MAHHWWVVHNRRVIRNPRDEYHHSTSPLLASWEKKWMSQFVDYVPIPARDQEILRLRLQGRTLKEISTPIGISTVNVANRISRALRRLEVSSHHLVWKEHKDAI